MRQAAAAAAVCGWAGRFYAAGRRDNDFEQLTEAEIGLYADYQNRYGFPGQRVWHENRNTAVQMADALAIAADTRYINIKCLIF